MEKSAAQKACIDVCVCGRNETNKTHRSVGSKQWIILRAHRMEFVLINIDYIGVSYEFCSQRSFSKIY